jgi:predicted RNase H-like nuclease (RuvC/YqgF family)
MHKEGCRKIDHYASFRRPTLSEICEHHGYEIKGRDIVKKCESVSNCDKSYCETSRQLDEAKSEIERLKEKLNPIRQMGACVEQVGNAIKLMKDLKEASQKTKIETLDDCIVAMRKEITGLECRNSELSLKLEALTDVDNQELARLQSENAKLKAENVKLSDMTLYATREMEKYKSMHKSVNESDNIVRSLIRKIVDELGMDLE